MNKTSIIACLTLLAACSEAPVVKYSTAVIDQAKEEFVPSQLLSADILCHYPVKMAPIDTLIAIQDINGSDLIRLYTLSGKDIACPVRQGDAPHQVPKLSEPFSLSQEGKIRVYHTPFIKEYDIAKFRNNERDYWRNISVTLSDSLKQYPIQFAEEHDGTLFLEGFTQEMRFAKVSPAQTPIIYNDYPALVSDPSKNIPVATYACKTVFRPDHRRWVQGTYIGAALEIFEEKEGHIRPVKQHFIYPPKYEVVDESHVTWGTESTIGFDDIYPTQEYFYALLSEASGSDLKSSKPRKPFTDTILVFDWDGNLVKRIRTDCMMMTLAATPANDACYAIAYGKMGYELRKISFQLPAKQ